MRRPDFDSLRAIEERLSTSITLLARQLAEGLLTLDELMMILEYCREDNGVPAQEYMMQAGLGRVTEMAAGYLLAALEGNKAQVITQNELAYMVEKFSD